ncbi:predicted protein [Histoplasma capsulatum G186AR]|uniref:Uncharacterized protein n=1 Tax=Ajellomyces capsulatus (strain G186AR / H82 / ATCC MYA-2454 / RMSCC 2432) TaxID=447093 RepID=C0NGT7_AJECG|nr:uncharacterized protein HCBG_02559 [Histoplasma capsulatum G186AR]EEH09022.1 predicted protein [Histoplasma capsulatum G186AR]
MPACFSKCRTGTNGSGRTAAAWVSIPVSSQLALTNQQGGGGQETQDEVEVVRRRTPSLSRWFVGWIEVGACPDPTEPPGKSGAAPPSSLRTSGSQAAGLCNSACVPRRQLPFLEGCLAGRICWSALFFGHGW